MAEQELMSIRAEQFWLTGRMADILRNGAAHKAAARLAALRPGVGALDAGASDRGNGAVDSILRSMRDKAEGWRSEHGRMELCAMGLLNRAAELAREHERLLRGGS